MEVEFTLALQKSLVALFAKDRRFAAIPVPGDIPDGIKVDLALFLHGDGSVDARASGYCFGYPYATTNGKLAELISVEYEKIQGHPPKRRDNYTKSLLYYYGYKRVDTQGPEVLIEHGFLTNAGERIWLFANISAIAAAEYVAVCKFFGYLPYDDGQNAKRKGALRRWILARHAEGWGWKRIKLSRNWTDYVKLGGK